MSQKPMPECAECIRLRELYWQAINESVRLSELIANTPHGQKRDTLGIEHSAAERGRIAMRDRFVAHTGECHDPWTPSSASS